MTFKKINVKMLAALVVALVVLCSLVFVAVEAGHDCSGEDCAICRQISACCDLLKNVLLHAVFAAFAISVLCAAIPAARLLAADGAYTLVSLKVKLSD